MAVSDWILAWLPPFVAPILLYYARQVAIRYRWIRPSFDSPDETPRQTLDALNEVRDVLHSINSNTRGLREDLVPTISGIKENVNRLKELGEARERDGGMLIYQRVPTPHVSSAAGHLGG